MIVVVVVRFVYNEKHNNALGDVICMARYMTEKLACLHVKLGKNVLQFSCFCCCRHTHTHRTLVIKCHCQEHT